MTLYLTRKRATIEAAKALLNHRKACDMTVALRRQRNADGSVDYGFAVTLLDHHRRPVVTL